MTVSDILLKLKQFRNKIRSVLANPLKANKNNESANIVEDARVHLDQLNRGVPSTKSTSTVVTALNSLKAKILANLPDPTRRKGKSRDVDFVDEVVSNINSLTTTTTAAPASTTAAPASTTAAPVSTTAAPVSTTVAP